MILKISIVLLIIMFISCIILSVIYLYVLNTNAKNKSNHTYKNTENKNPATKTNVQSSHVKPLHTSIQSSHLYKDVKFKRFMNRQEKYLYTLLCHESISRHFVVFPQVGLNALVTNTDYREWGEYSGFCVDFLFCLKKSLSPVLVLEYNGGGHYFLVDDDIDDEWQTQNAIKRDRKKLEVLARAEIECLFLENENDDREVIKHFIEKDLRAKLNEILQTRCPRCGGKLEALHSRSGRYLGHKNYKARGCDYTRDL